MKRLISTGIAVPAILAVIFCGCAKKEDAGNKVIARASNTVITEKDLKARIAKMPAYYQNIVEKDPKRYVEEMIVEALCYEEGVRGGIDRDKEVRELVNDAKKKIVMAKLVKNEVEDKIVVTEEEMKKFYDEHKVEFKTPAMWRASHILVSDEKEALAVADEIAKGAKFEDLARTHSIDATATRGGDVGFFREGQLVPDFERACLKLEIGQTSGVVQTQFGYHIIKLTDKKEPGVKTFQEAKRTIEADLKKQKQAELFNALVMKLKNKYKVEVNENAFEKAVPPK
ncbi:MAG: peptidyl-prolyl cis-trans isomerase [Candidatus Omnitrophica bacterium]|nr:peptidyl-prolyl cis-trans isomerase [Candidatus Omnitrophota bacterium]MDD5436743.1 peptidyl-prolyl cis-trans isomerase [Candidatus Omnitrophota bacterium]